MYYDENDKNSNNAEVITFVTNSFRDTDLVLDVILIINFYSRCRLNENELTYLIFISALLRAIT